MGQGCRGGRGRSVASWRGAGAFAEWVEGRRQCRGAAMRMTWDRDGDVGSARSRGRPHLPLAVRPRGDGTSSLSAWTPVSRHWNGGSAGSCAHLPCHGPAGGRGPPRSRSRLPGLHRRAQTPGTRRHAQSRRRHGRASPALPAEPKAGGEPTMRECVARLGEGSWRSCRQEHCRVPGK